MNSPSEYPQTQCAPRLADFSFIYLTFPQSAGAPSGYLARNGPQKQISEVEDKLCCEEIRAWLQ